MKSVLLISKEFFVRGGKLCLGLMALAVSIPSFGDTLTYKVVDGLRGSEGSELIDTVKFIQ